MSHLNSQAVPKYHQRIMAELELWKRQMLRNPSLFNKLSKKIQTRINTWIPERLHVAITAAIRQMIKGVLFGAKHTTEKAWEERHSLQEKEIAVTRRIEFYKTTAAVEGGITGAGGILLGLADFPILLGLKVKLLFDIAAIYGFDVRDYKERIYLLHIFELAFSSQQHRKQIYLTILNWEEKSKLLPDDLNQFNWRNFQQEYRDYIDLAKLAQFIPIIGAPVGAVVNFKLIRKLGFTAMNAYRLRLTATN